MTGLLAELHHMIVHEGPLTVARYMALCLGHPLHGYYTTRDPFGAAGDFTTAPEISQMFGELIGLWAIEMWALMGSPTPVRLVELGPGRGTLMQDILHVARLRPAFREAIAAHLVETSPALCQAQQQRLGAPGPPVTWHERLAEVPEGPAIVIANEFFDALPVRQFVFTERGWCERLVGLGAADDLVFGVSPEPEASITAPGRLGDIVELPEAGLRLVAELAQRLSAHRSAALLIDYGYEGPAFGDTLQAVKRHAYADPLADPGKADLTTHVNFTSLATAASAKGVRVHGPVPQGRFLRSLGIEARAAGLKSRATSAQAAEIDAALWRLTGAGPAEMGQLFKVMGLTHPLLPVPPGFVDESRSL